MRDRRLSSKPEPRPLLRILQGTIVDFAVHGVEISDLIRIEVKPRVFERIKEELRGFHSFDSGTEPLLTRDGMRQWLSFAGMHIETVYK